MAIVSMECSGSFLVPAAGRVRERAPQGEKRPRLQLQVAARVRLGGRSPKTLEPRLESPDADGGCPGIELRPSGGPTGDRGDGSAHSGGLSRGNHAWPGLDAELAPEELHAC
jgi:hypothetical protein